MVGSLASHPSCQPRCNIQIEKKKNRTFQSLRACHPTGQFRRVGTTRHDWVDRRLLNASWQTHPFFCKLWAQTVAMLHSPCNHLPAVTDRYYPAPRQGAARTSWRHGSLQKSAPSSCLVTDHNKPWGVSSHPCLHRFLLAQVSRALKPSQSGKAGIASQWDEWAAPIQGSRRDLESFFPTNPPPTQPTSEAHQFHLGNLVSRSGSQGGWLAPRGW